MTAATQPPHTLNVKFFARRTHMHKIKTAIITISSIALFAVLFVGIGILNIQNYQDRAIAKSEDLLTEHFANRNEVLDDLVHPDYSLGSIEIGAITDKDTYYVAVGDVTPLWVQITALNLFITPKIEIGSIEPKKF